MLQTVRYKEVLDLHIKVDQTWKVPAVWYVNSYELEQNLSRLEVSQLTSSLRTY